MPDRKALTPQVVFVPGAFTGPWMWGPVIERLDVAGIGSLALELPTIGEGPATRLFADDVATVRAALDGLGTPVVLVGHSYGGAVITDAASGPHRSVRELIYVAGAAPGSGESMATATAAAGERAGVEPGGPGPAPREDGLMAYPPEVARQALFNDVDDALARQALDQMRPQSFNGVDAPIEIAAWTQLPSVYVRGEQDLVPRAVGDDFLASCAAVIDVPTGHCPHWSDPDRIAEIIAARVRGASPAGA